MKPRYVVINEMDRDDFEQKYALSYGYGDCEVHMDVMDAIEELEEYYDTNEWVVEEISNGGRQIVYRGGLRRG